MSFCPVANMFDSIARILNNPLGSSYQHEAESSSHSSGDFRGILPPPTTDIYNRAQRINNGAEYSLCPTRAT